MSRIISKIEDRVLIEGGGGGTPDAHASTHGDGGTDAITISKDQISDFPTSLAPTAHASSHGSAGSDAITIAKTQISDATATPTAGKIPIADGSGKLDGWITPGGVPSSHASTHGAGQSDAVTIAKSQISDFPAFGTTAGSICQGNDSRLSDSRTPTSHSHAKADLTDATTTPGAGKIPIADGSGKLDSWVTGGGTPSAHAASHASGQSDALTLTKNQISDFPSSMTPTAHAAGHAYGQSDALTLTKNQISDFPSTMTPTAHASGHITGASDEIDGDKLDIDWNPSNYTPTTVTEADNADHLAAHLKGIDTALGSVGGSSNSVTITAGEALSQYDTVYLHTDGKCYKASNASTKAVAEVYAIVTQSGGISSSGTGTALRQGDVTNASWSFASAGLTVYLSTAGALTTTETTASGAFWVPCGETTGTNSIYFSPSTGVLIGTASGAPILTGALASRPSAGAAGRIYLPTDGYPMSYDNGSSWDTYLNGFKCTAPPAASSLSQIHFTLSAGTSSLTDFNGGLLFTQTGNNSSQNKDYSYAVVSIPGGANTYSFTVGVEICASLLLSTCVGVCLTDGAGATPKAVIYGHITGDAGSYNRFNYAYVSSPTAAFSSQTNKLYGSSLTNLLFIRVRDDRTNLTVSISHDGINFLYAFNNSRSTFFTPTHIGLVLGQESVICPTTELRAYMKVFHWSLA